MSVLSLLSKEYPNKRIILLCAPSSKCLENSFRNISFVYFSWKNFFLILSRMLKKHQLVLSFFPGRMNSILFRLSRSEEKFGYPSLKKIFDWHLGSQFALVKPNKNKRFIWEPDQNYLNRISLFTHERFNQNIKTKVSLFDDKEIVLNNKTIIICPFSKDSRRMLSELQVLKLSTYYNMYNIIIIMGNEKEIESYDKAKFLQKNLSFNYFYDLTVTTKLFMSNLLLVVDSFPIHLADAHNTKFIGLFSNTNPNSVLVNSETSIKFDTITLSDVPTDILIEKIQEKFAILQGQ